MHEFRLLLLCINRLILCSSYFLLSTPSLSLFHFHINITVYHGIRTSHSSANNTSTLEGSVVALITNSHKCARMYIGMADYTFSITLLTKVSNSNSWLLPAHNQIRMMLGHDLFKILVLLRAPTGIDLRLCCFSFSRERGKPGETSTLNEFFFYSCFWFWLLSHLIHEILLCLLVCLLYVWYIVKLTLLLLQIFNFLQDSSFSIFDSLLFYLLHSKNSDYFSTSDCSTPIREYTHKRFLLPLHCRISLYFSSSLFSAFLHLYCSISL